MSKLFLAAIAVAALAGPATACEMHQSHATLTTVEAVPVPPPVPRDKPVIIEGLLQTQIAVVSQSQTGDFFGYSKRNQTVYPTH